MFGSWWYGNPLSLNAPPTGGHSAWDKTEKKIRLYLVPAYWQMSCDGIFWSPSKSQKMIYFEMPDVELKKPLDLFLSMEKKTQLIHFPPSWQSSGSKWGSVSWRRGVRQVTQTQSAVLAVRWDTLWWNLKVLAIKELLLWIIQLYVRNWIV